MDAFDDSQIRALVIEAPSEFVHHTLAGVIKAGLLTRYQTAGQSRFRWAGQPVSTRQRTERLDRWIDAMLRGAVSASAVKEPGARERMIDRGPDACSDADLLALLIRTGIAGHSAIEGAAKLAEQFHGQFERLQDYGLTEMRRITPAVTSVGYASLMAAVELGRRIELARQTRVDSGVRITSTVEAVRYCENRFADLARNAVREEFHIVTLDTKHKPIRTHRITVGTLDASLVHPREVFRPAIRDSAAAVLLVHNHPSGDPAPSREDHAVTDRLTQAGELIGITVLDHIVVAAQRCVSIRES